VMAAPPTRQRVVDAAVAVLREHRGTATVAATVMGVYRADARFKDYVKAELGTTVLDLLQQHPEHFALDASKSLVALATGEDSAHVYTMEEVARHNHKADAWIVVNGDVYDITEFVRTHWGWNSAGKNSTIIAIMSALGSDCTTDFEEVHHGLAMWPTIKAQLDGFYIGKVKPPYKGDGGRVPYHTWDELVAMGRIPKDIMPVQREDGTWESRQFK
jgi:cytochrome b involved in lipid metabolism